MDFPASPTVGQSFTVGNRTWVWTGSTWDTLSTDNLNLTSAATLSDVFLLAGM